MKQIFRKFFYFLFILFLVIIFPLWKSYKLENFEKNIISEPVQKRIFFEKKWQIENFEITPRAKYKIAGRVVLTENIKDQLEISSKDISLVWGSMIDSSILNYFTWRHSGRVMFRDFRSDVPLPYKEIESHSGNIHTVPANMEVSQTLDKIEVGDEIFAYGKLIDVKNIKTGMRWNTSLFRGDWGYPVSCEILWIEKLEILKKTSNKIETKEEVFDENSSFEVKMNNF